MPISIKKNGTDNVLSISATDLRDGNGLVEFHGNGSAVSIATPHAWGRPRITVADKARVVIGPGCVLGNLVVFVGPGAEVQIGARTGFSGATSLMAHEPVRIIIGDGCLFGSETHVLASDMHSIIDRSSRQRINPARDIIIGARVWIGFRVVVLKGTRIGEGAIIGAGAVVSGDIAPYCAAVGNPARPVRDNVTWHQSLLPTE
jgi:acetyltransferase-like isoleucine patch superfamily enzyme